VDVPRLILVEKPFYTFSTSIEVRLSDINYAMHVGSTQMAGIVHDARYRVLTSLGFNEGNLGDGKTSIVIGDLAIQFKSEAFLGTVLTVESHFDEIAEKGFRLFHRIKHGGVLIALAETGIICYNYQERRPVQVPVAFIQKLQEYLANI
jgi:acyl-CoA thioester hydrolase